MIKQRPESRCWFAYYIFDPIRDMCYSFGDLLSTLWIKMKGGWYCEYCGKIHNRRVYKYNCLDAHLDIAAGTLRDISGEHGRFVCSLGRDAALHEGWKPQSIKLEDKLFSDMVTAFRAFINRDN